MGGDGATQFPGQLHDHMTKAGFVFRDGRYFQTTEPVWEKAKRIEKGKKQYAVPATSVEQFLKDEEKMVDARLKRYRDKAGLKGDASDNELEEAPKKKKETKVEVEAEVEEAPKKKKKEAKVEVEEEAEE
mmetsp:Transcript_13672/g.36330  ORF Transcript_13672/g.36330 Transcript_13672/m.36330 type:complete len:130 (+) Transcript_13672:81-470(+)